MQATNATSRTQDNTQENMHEEGGGMRATNVHRTTSRRKYTKQEEDEMRTTKEPCGQVRGSHTAHKGGGEDEKGKRKSEKHGALCEAEHRKTKKKIQTRKHDQKKRKHHREIDTLRADAGKN